MVTKTTISLALRDCKSISKATRERVQKLAIELNYRPDPAISAIAAQRWGATSSERNRALAYICHSKPLCNISQGQFLKAATFRANQLGYKLEPFFVDKYPNANAVTRVLHWRGIRGLIIPAIPNPDSTRTTQIEWNKFTAVCCGVGRIRPPLHTVTSDVFAIVRLMWEIIASAGFKRAGAAINRHTPLADDDWYRLGASRAAIELLGLEQSAAIPFLTTHPEDEAALVSWYHQHKPEVIIGFNYSTGEMLERNGIRIPQDVEFLCLMTPENSRWSGFIRQFNQIARASVDLLHNEIRENHWGLPAVPNFVLIEPQWNAGETFTHSSLAQDLTTRKKITEVASILT